MNVQIDGHSLTFEQLHEVAFGGAEVALAPAARARMEAARATIVRKFTADRMVARTLEQYDELLRSSPRSG